MVDRSIIFSVRFEGSLRQDHTIQYLTEIFKTRYNKSFQELNYTITDKTKFYWKQKNKGGKYTQKSFDKFKETLTRSGDKILVDFELLTNLDNCEYKSRDIDVSVDYSQVDRIKSLNFVFNSSWGLSVDFTDFAMIICTMLAEQNCEVLYGVTFEMENSKMPIFFIQGIRSENLSRNEQEMVNVWSANRESCSEMVWDIFWGNILSRNHLLKIRSRLDQIESLGWDVKFLGNDLIWIRSRERLSDFSIKDYKGSRKYLHSIFEESNLIMHEVPDKVI